MSGSRPVQKNRTSLPILLWVGLALTACDRTPRLPAVSSPEYREAASAFFTGVAAVQVGEIGLAESALQRVTELAPAEPAAWADLGLLALQQRDLDGAAERLERARDLAEGSPEVQLLSGVVSRERGNRDQAMEHFGRAAELAPNEARPLYLQAQMLAQSDPARAQELLERVLAIRPGNLFALLERARLAARAGDGASLRKVLASAASRVANPALAARITQARDAARVAELQAELERLPAYRADRDALALSPRFTDLLLTRFLRLPNPSSEPAPADTGLTLAPAPLSGAEGEPAELVRSLWLAEEAPIAVLAADSRELRVRAGSTQQELAFPGGRSAEPLRPGALAAIDYNYDFRNDLVLAGEGGLRLLRQDSASFVDATAAIPAAVAQGAYAGAWPADLDMDGDMDLVLAQASGPPLALTNGGDGQFTPRSVFEGTNRLRDFVWADLDAEGTPDAAMIDANGQLHVFHNRRFPGPQFLPRPVPHNLGRVHALAVADLNRDAVIDLVALQENGAIVRLSLVQGRWESEVLARWPQFTSPPVGTARLFLADLDSNGALDLVASSPTGTRIWLHTAEGFRAHQALEARITDVADFRSEGRLDLIGVAPNGAPTWFANRGTLDYYSLTLRPRASRADGDRRINPFGIGGEAEVRAGPLYQKQVIQGPSVHFGLGTNQEATVTRILWPNGTPQAEFRVAATNEAALQAEQRLKGSCPWVFTFNGTEMQYVTDFIWRTALGLRINLQGTADVIHSEDWIRIRGDQLVPRDGYYDVRITADLWESHFFDYVSLMVVDHPAGTEVFVDERFKLPPPPLGLHAMSPLRAIRGAWDHHGRDVTDIVQAQDARYLDTFGLGTYQGLAEEHYVEVDLGDAPSAGPLWLVLHGWLYPTDSSINLAISQGDHPPLEGLQLEVPDGIGGWVVAQPDLGMPSGKAKTILINLQDAFRPGTPRRVRLRTSMEIYWDRIAWAAGRADTPVRTQRLLPQSMELRYRGFSAVSKPTRRSPEVPDYNNIATTAQKWRDMEGYHTRYGDVRPLVSAVDGRYVIMSAGDELRFRFPELPPPPDGWKRDFVLVGDGWVKDGDFNTGFSRTILPLPYRGMTAYDRTPTRLEDDPAYRLHPDDWKIYHTRYVAPEAFHNALVPTAGR